MMTSSLKTIGIVVVLVSILGAVAIFSVGAVYANRQGGAAAQIDFGAAADDGVLVALVRPDGPAAGAGVVRGDIILAMDGDTVDYVDDLREQLADLAAGDEVTLTVMHGDDERTLTVTLGERGGQPFMGITPCSCDRRHAVGIRPFGHRGAITDVIEDSPAAEAGLQAGDVVLAVDGEVIGPDNTLVDAIAAHTPGDSVTLTIMRSGEDEFDVTVTLGEHPDKEGVAYLGVGFRFDFDMMLGGDFDHAEGLAGHYGRGFPEGFIFGAPFRGEDGDFTFPGGDAEQGVVIGRVEDGGAADEAGLAQGDVIVSVGGEAFDSISAFTDLIAARAPGDSVALAVVRAGGDTEDVDVVLGENPDEPGAGYLGISVGGFFIRHTGEGNGDILEFSIEGEPLFDGSHLGRFGDGPHLERFGDGLPFIEFDGQPGIPYPIGDEI